MKLLKLCILVDEIFIKGKKTKEEIYGGKQIWLSPNSDKATYHTNATIFVVLQKNFTMFFHFLWNETVELCLT